MWVIFGAIMELWVIFGAIMELWVVFGAIIEFGVIFVTITSIDEAAGISCDLVSPFVSSTGT